MTQPTDAAPDCNVEIKARLASLDAARQVARTVADRQLPDQQQIDTYFHCRHGRLKLREIVGERAELIAYDRANQAEAKTSRYYVIPVETPGSLKEGLAATLGIRGVVEKHREIYLHRNVRIHLDAVRGLGAFLEFEAVLSDQHGEVEARQLVADLRRCFQIADDQLLTHSYGEMIDELDESASR